MNTCIIISTLINHSHSTLSGYLPFSKFGELKEATSVVARNSPPHPGFIISIKI